MIDSCSKSKAFANLLHRSLLLPCAWLRHPAGNLPSSGVLVLSLHAEPLSTVFIRARKPSWYRIHAVCRSQRQSLSVNKSEFRKRGWARNSRELATPSIKAEENS